MEFVFLPGRIWPRRPDDADHHHRASTTRSAVLAQHGRSGGPIAGDVNLAGNPQRNECPQTSPRAWQCPARPVRRREASWRPSDPTPRGRRSASALGSIHKCDTACFCRIGQRFLNPHALLSSGNNTAGHGTSREDGRAKRWPSPMSEYTFTTDSEGEEGDDE